MKIKEPLSPGLALTERFFCTRVVLKRKKAIEDIRAYEISSEKKEN